MPAERPYHKYVFNFEDRQFLGKFEEMYQAEESEGFDSWQQHDLRPLRKQIGYAILSPYEFGRILDVGCGKGSFTHLLKKENNYVLGIDSSETAIRKAQESFPDIDFRSFNLERIASLGEAFDLTVATAILGYLDNWPRLLQDLAGMTRWLFIAEYIPPQPIGFVKSSEQLVAEVEKNFTVKTKVILDDLYCLLLGETRIGEEKRKQRGNKGS